MARRNRTPEEKARRAKIRELLQMANIGSMDDIQNLFKETIAEFMENGLEAELDDELGYSKYDYKNKDTNNSRNGYSSKTLRTSFGDAEVSVPRDRKGEFEPQLLKKNQTSISQDIEEKILSMYAKGMSTSDIETHIRDIYGVEVSDTTVSRITDKILPIAKEWQQRPLEATAGRKSLFMPVNGSVPDVVEKRKNWNGLMSGFKASDLVFLDESGCNTDMTRRYAYSLGGSRAVDSAPLSKPKNTTILSSIQLDGTLHYTTFSGGTTVEHFKQYLKEDLLPHLNCDSVLVMDNMKSHHAKAVKNLLDSSGIRYIYLPPYSPDLNPIEKLWSKVKALLRKFKARSLDALPNAIQHAFQNVSPSDCSGWFRSCGYAACFDEVFARTVRFTQSAV